MTNTTATIDTATIDTATVDNCHELTPINLFHWSLQQIFKQGQRSATIGGSCYYRYPPDESSNTLKCAVGHCIKDADYNPHMEGKPVGYSGCDGFTPHMELRVAMYRFSPEQIHILGVAQRIHDNASDFQSLKRTMTDIRRIDPLKWVGKAPLPTSTHIDLQQLMEELPEITAENCHELPAWDLMMWAADQVIRQGMLSESDECGCVYRLPMPSGKTLKCGVGQVIPDKDYNAVFEGQSIHAALWEDDFQSAALLRSVLERFNHDQRNALIAVQKLHDLADDFSVFEERIAKLRTIVPPFENIDFEAVIPEEFLTHPAKNLSNVFLPMPERS